MTEGFDDDSCPESFLDIIAVKIFEEDFKVLNGFNAKHHEYYMELIYRTKFLPHYSSLKERFWHIYMKTEDKPLCLLDTCMNQVTWHRIYGKNNTYCSRGCARNHYWIKKKAEESSNSS